MSKNNLSIEDIEKMSEPVLTPKQVAGALNCSERLLRQQLKDDPSLFGFPVTIIYCKGGYAKISIPRLPFIRYLTFGVVDDN